MNPWITYRTRFLVKAKQLTSNLSFTDDLGRQHSGCKGDYLVEWSDGVLRISPRKIFEDVYVPMTSGEGTSHSAHGLGSSWDLLRNPVLAGKHSQVSITVHLARKAPQPCRERRSLRQDIRSL